MQSKCEALLAEALALRVRRYKNDPHKNRLRREWYELGFRDGWKAALEAALVKNISYEQQRN